MLRNIVKVVRPSCETATVLSLNTKQVPACKFSTIIEIRRTKVRRNDCRISYKQCVRYIRGASGHRPRVSEFQNENQESAKPRRKFDDPEETQRQFDNPEGHGTRQNSEKRPPFASNSKTVKEMLSNSASFSEMGQRSPETDWSTPPYPKKVYNRIQASHAIRPTTDPKETCIILFPGQGIQYVGMGKNLLKYPNVKRIYNTASEILGYDLLDICLKGPIEELKKTVYCQPAIVATSLAAVEKLKDEAPHTIESCIAVAGFSVGEITALMFAKALSFTDGMKLVRIRAEAMQNASEMADGGMVTVFYGPDARIGYACAAAKEWCKRKGLAEAECGIANYLYPGCKVLAGNEEALKFIALNAKDFGIRRMKRLSVSGAFHTKLMLSAQEAMAYAMESIQVDNPVISVHSNFDGKRYRHADHIKRQLPKQISSPVKWEQTLHVLYERDVGTAFPRTYECGPGRSMKAILEKVNAKASDCTTSVDMDELY